MAHAFIDAAARAGADAIKFQTHIAAAESGATDTWRVKFSFQDKTRYDYWRRMEFTEEQWAGLRRHADARKLYFLSSPFSVEAVDLLKRVGVAAWKIASGEVNNIPMFERMAETGLPMLISTGMSPLKEIDAAISRARHCQIPVTVFQCTSAYPCPPTKAGLNLIPLFRERYSCGVGLSDHSGTIFPALAACTLGVDAIETHVIFSRDMFGPDVMSSITLDELRQLVDGVRFIMAMVRNPLDKDVVAEEMQPLRNVFMKSVVVTQNLSRRRLFARRGSRGQEARHRNSGVRVSRSRWAHTSPLCGGRSTCWRKPTCCLRSPALRVLKTRRRAVMTKTHEHTNGAGISGGTTRLRRIATVLVDRSNYGRMWPVMREIQQDPVLKLLTVCAGTMLLSRFWPGGTCR